jgi:phospholipase/lecithinase/hemolysin
MEMAMQMMMMMMVMLPMIVIVIVGSSPATASRARYSALFVLGDSLVDVGNNNFIATVARSDMKPFGIDFAQGPTGRFCNGKVVVDFIGP